MKDKFVSDVVSFVSIFKFVRQYLFFNGNRTYCTGKYCVSLSVTSRCDTWTPERKKTRQVTKFYRYLFMATCFGFWKKTIVRN